MSKEIQRETNKLIDRCYTKGSRDLMVFQRQKFLNEVFPLLDGLGVVIRADKKINGNLINDLWDAVIDTELDNCKLLVKQALDKAGYVATESLICSCKKEPCTCPSINRGSFAKYVEEGV